MPAPFDIDIKDPYILLGLGSSLWGIISADNIGLTGEVIQINAATTFYAEGDIVFYDSSKGSIIFDGTNYYTLIDESYVYYKELSPP